MQSFDDRLYILYKNIVRKVIAPTPCIRIAPTYVVCDVGMSYKRYYMKQISFGAKISSAGHSFAFPIILCGSLFPGLYKSTVVLYKAARPCSSENKRIRLVFCRSGSTFIQSTLHKCITSMYQKALSSIVPAVLIFGPECFLE